ncbi:MULTISPECIES: ribonuclease HI family protein [Planococcus]|uniref:Ribonuclease H n=2 Tax=Planococcus TaxID=1372 RepID=A0ABM5WW61_9BACL|nr:MULTISPECIES: ribonuclease HI family protein [Planococcus]ALS78559.1 ribonuclease H [Planococcus kocurii]AQU79458.1 ribonuclease HI [Planococcus faecalis]KAA0956433.1 ribonuclease HI family protein [Planococcus sp. ANT_H30]MDJ0332537.1 ribonuclease HI family protein [Planococcus sp. S3-L1]OHX51426.1 ribonuclease HI [Planococcus faecalis]
MLEVFVDAATAGSPQVSAVGVFIRGEGHLIHWSEYVGEMDNHTAEFTALVKGLELAIGLTSGMVSIKSDSQVAVNAFEKRGIKNAKFKPLLLHALELGDQFDFCFIKWIPDSQNRAADALARTELRAHK